MALSIVLLMMLPLISGCSGIGGLFGGKDSGKNPTDSLPWVSEKSSSSSISASKSPAAESSSEVSSQSSSQSSSVIVADYDEVSITYAGVEYVVHLGTSGINVDGQTTVQLLGYDIANITVFYADGEETLPVHMIIVAGGVEYEWTNADVDSTGYNYVFDTSETPELIYIYAADQRGNTSAYIAIDPATKLLVH